MKNGIKSGVLCIAALLMFSAFTRTPETPIAYAAGPRPVSNGNQDGNACTGSATACASVDGALTAAPPAPATARVQSDFGRMPLYFIANQGQMDSRVAYYIQASDKTLYFASDGVTFMLTAPAPEKNGAQTRNRWSLKLDFVGTNYVRPIGEAQTDAIISYFKGAQDEWRTGLPTYSKIVYPDLWDGIDLVYSGTTNRLKYEFVVKPGADPARIRFAYRGATVRLNDAGQLEIGTPAGGFQDDTPTAYQQANGQRMPVQASFAVNDTTSSSADEMRIDEPSHYGFNVGAYDPTLPLVIDPTVLVYAGYIGGSGGDLGNGIAIDTAGNAYVTGRAGSTETTFPVTVGPDLTHNGGSDAFVAKVKADGSGLVYAGYIGGSGNDQGNGIAVDTAGNAYVTGYTESSEATFPVTVGPDLIFNYNSDAFVAKVKPDGTGLVYAGYIGGWTAESGNGIAVDSAGNAYVVGETSSDQYSFPVTVGPGLFLSYGSIGAFVAKVKADGTGLLYAGYIGSNGSNASTGIAVDSGGNAYVTGWTYLSEASFPATVGPDLTHNGYYDAFVAKVKADGTGFVYAGYVGGSEDDRGYGITVDTAGNAYVTGYTYSTEATFPVTVGPDLTFNGIYYDAFVAKVKADGTGLVYSGYIGGDGRDRGTGIAVDTTGSAYITGETAGSDAFVAKVKADGTGLVYTGYIGGSDSDRGNAIAVDSAGNAYVTGYTHSSEATFPVTVGPDLTYNGGDDAFVAKVSYYIAPFAAISKSANKTGVSLSEPLSFTVAITMNTGIPPTSVFVTDTLPSQLSYIPNSLSASSGSYGYAAGVITWNGTATAGSTLTVSFGATIPNLAFGSLSNSAVISGHGETYTRTATVEVQGSSICNLAKNPSGTVLGVGASGAWDSASVWDSTVLKEGGTYKMWYTGRDASNNRRIGYATSSDGITWTKYGSNPVLSPSEAWEGTRVSSPTVINDGGTYKMWYAGRDSGGVTRIGYATSPDGITWTKGSVPVLNPGAFGSWEDAYISGPSVVKVGGTFHMWYEGYDGVTSRIGHASSPEGMGWTKDAANPVLNLGNPGGWDWLHVYGPSVVLYNGKYLLWYSGDTLPAASQTGYAISSDGSTWTRKEKLIPQGGAGAFDGFSADYASVIADGIGFKIWYSGMNSAGTYTIGYATAGVCGPTTQPPTPVTPPANPIYLPNIGRNMGQPDGQTCPAYYSENFGDSNSGWPISDDTNRRYAYVSSEYQIWVKASSQGWSVTPGAMVQDFTASVTARPAAASSGEYGIVFGIDEAWGSFYEVDLRGNTYSIWKYYGNWTALKGWTASGFINAGTTPNRLKVIRDGANIAVYVNNQYLTTVADGSLTGLRRIGLTASSPSNGTIDARFDDFSLYPASCGPSALAPSRGTNFRIGKPESHGGTRPPQ